MTIRRRLTIWYAGLLLLGLTFICGSIYYELSVEHPSVRRALAREGESPLEEMGEVLLYGGLPAFALALIGGWFVMRRALSPLTQLTRAIERIHAENLRQPLALPGHGDELDRLTEVFNEMTRRLDDSFQRVREFTLHASHELKTPLTVIRNELDAALRENSLPSAERERCAVLLEEIERLSQIVDGLNFLTRADAGLLKLDQAPVRFDELLRDACDDALVLAQPHQIEVRLDCCETATVAGDRRRLRQMLLILTDNAVKYNWPGGRVTAALRVQEEQAVLTLSNTGPGIPKEMAERVFDRFFRVDASRNHEIEGSGLGLTIAQGIVHAHGGQIHVASELNRLTTVTVLLPSRVHAKKLRTELVPA